MSIGVQDEATKEYEKAQAELNETKRAIDELQSRLNDKEREVSFLFEEKNMCMNHLVQFG